MAEAEGTAEPRQLNNIQYFKDFLSDKKNQRLISMLRCVLGELGTGLAHTSVFFVRVKSANCNSYANFKKATLDAEVQRNEDSFPIVAPFVIFFLHGYAALVSFLDRKDPKIPEKTAEQQALKDLLNFLTNKSKQSAFIGNEDKGQTELDTSLALRTAQHLLVSLAPDKTFVTDSLSDAYPGHQLSDCSPVQHTVNGYKGDTSFGCAKGWHGRADILLMDDETEIPFVVVEKLREDGDPETGSVCSDSSMSSDPSVNADLMVNSELLEKIKNGDNFSPESIAQATAQAIVSSFVQHKKNPKSPNTLVPGFGICSNKLIVNMYDCVEDILLTTGPIDLFANLGGCSLNLRAIIILWLGLHHGLFGNKTPEKYTSNTSDLHRLIGPVQLEAYFHESELPFKTTLDDGLDSNKYFDDLNEETADSLDDAAEYITNEKLGFISLK